MQRFNSYCDVLYHKIEQANFSKYYSYYVILYKHKITDLVPVEPLLLSVFESVHILEIGIIENKVLNVKKTFSDINLEEIQLAKENYLLTILIESFGDDNVAIEIAINEFNKIKSDKNDFNDKKENNLNITRD